MILATLLLVATLLTNLLDVVSAVSAGRTDAHFDLSGSILSINRTKSALFILKSTDSHMVFRDITENRQSRSFQPGNIIRVKGCVSVNEYNYPAANCQSLEFIAAGTPPPVSDVSTSDLTTKSFNGQLIRVQGVVREVFRDEIDPKYIYLTLADKAQTFTVSLCDDLDHDTFAHALIDARISAVGVYSAMKNGLRKFSGWTLTTYGTNNISILSPAPADPFVAPLLSNANAPSPSAVAALGKQKISGRVIAVRAGRDFLIVDSSGTPRHIRPRNTAFPSFGDIIEAVGYPETDLYRLNLGDALWRKTGRSEDIPAAVDTDLSRILTDGKGNPKINPLFHGKAIRVVGTLIDMPRANGHAETLTLKCSAFSIPIDISANSNLASMLTVGCRLSVSGTCIVETDNWRPYSVFPHATGITLVVRRPDDVVIVSQPPWWTPGKLLIIISSLLLALVAFVVWNRALNRLVSKRSHALIKEQVALAEAEMKIDERTRLAIELHDSLSQNLSAVAFQIVATKSAVALSPSETIDNLNAAERMLLSCRTELKRCLWDLRNDALDIRNMTDVIQRVLAPVKGNAVLSIRFNVARSKLDDSELHAIICIIRELVSNAIQHGHATHVGVAGDLTDGALSFSVKDDGDGFEPSHCKGSAEGHFGLEGIRDRVKRFHGNFDIKSARGKGSYAKIRFPLQPCTQEETKS